MFPFHLTCRFWECGIQCCAGRLGRRHTISVYFHASLKAHAWCLLLPLLCWKKPTTNHLDGVTHPHRGVRVFNTALGSCPPPSEVSLRAPWVLHNCSGGGGWGRRGCGEGPEVDDKRFFFSLSYGRNSLLMNAGRVCSAAHLNPEATRHFAAYVTAARQRSGNNGGNNLDLCLKSIRGTFRHIPLSVIFSCSSPSTPQRENVVVFKHTDITYLIRDSDRDKTSLLFIWNGEGDKKKKKKNLPGG